MLINDLILTHTGLARAIAYRHWRRWDGELAEWQAEALYWLVRLARRWRPELGPDFQAYIATWLPRRLLNVSANERLRRKGWPAPAPLPDDFDTADHRHGDPADVALARDAVAYGLARLDWREAHVIRNVELRQRSAAQVARDTGLTEARVSRLRAQGRARLAELLAR